MRTIKGMCLILDFVDWDCVPGIRAILLTRRTLLGYMLLKKKKSGGRMFECGMMMLLVHVLGLLCVTRRSQLCVTGMG
jgi:hypothetical protein